MAEIRSDRTFVVQCLRHDCMLTDVGNVQEAYRIAREHAAASPEHRVIVFEASILAEVQ